MRLHDEGLFKEYLFNSHLIKLLHVDKVDIMPITDKISLKYVSLKKSFEGAIILDKKSVEFVPSADKKKSRVVKKDTLQRIIDKVNDRYAGEFTDSERNIVGSMYSMFMGDTDIKKYKSYAKSTSAEMFVKSLFPDKFKDIAVRCFTENHESFEKLFSDSDFYQKVMEAIAYEIYKELRKD